ncbi:MAG: DNA-3-methyladenine glycosylase 2 family protein [Saprospiraceae bacterium]|nr:DNA-3-methyladenine glycosylase 2 family protein [Saprospiraceae bacterium]
MKEKLAQNDPILKEIIATIPEPIIESTHDVFFDLMSCIVEQQIHYRSTKRIFPRLLEKAGLTTLNLDNFSEFEKVLPTITLATSKYETLAATSDFFQNNKINWQLLSDAEVIEKLGLIKGIGKWTIDMILLYTLERPNVFPYDDFHVKEIMVKLYGLNPNSRLKAQMLEIAENWGEHKSLAVKYLLAYKAFNLKRK